MDRHASIIKIKISEFNKYKKLHEKIWPELAKIIKDCNIINYSIYYKDGFLFSYFNYIGKDFKGYIPSSDHSVQGNVSAENYDYFIEIIREYGNYPIELDNY